jgi:hypothetical protein
MPAGGPRRELRGVCWGPRSPQGCLIAACLCQKCNGWPAGRSGAGGAGPAHQLPRPAARGRAGALVRPLLRLAVIASPVPLPCPCPGSASKPPRMRPYLLKGHERPLTQVKFNREGDIFISCSKSYQPGIWFTEDGMRLGGALDAALRGHSVACACGAGRQGWARGPGLPVGRAAPRSRRHAAPPRMGVHAEWGGTSRRPAGTFDGHNGTVWTCEISRDSSRLVTASADQTVRTWELSTGRELHQVTMQVPCRCAGAPRLPPAPLPAPAQPVPPSMQASRGLSRSPAGVCSHGRAPTRSPPLPPASLCAQSVRAVGGGAAAGLHDR